MKINDIKVGVDYYIGKYDFVVRVLLKVKGDFYQDLKYSEPGERMPVWGSELDVWVNKKGKKTFLVCIGKKLNRSLCMNLDDTVCRPFIVLPKMLQSKWEDRLSQINKVNEIFERRSKLSSLLREELDLRIDTWMGYLKSHFENHPDYKSFEFTFLRVLKSSMDMESQRFFFTTLISWTNSDLVANKDEALKIRENLNESFNRSILFEKEIEDLRTELQKYC